MLELIAGILLAAGAVYFVLRPLLAAGAAASGTADGGEVEEGADPDDDLSPRAVALRALREIEFDRATGKLSDADYDELKAKYTTEALAALRAQGRQRFGCVLGLQLVVIPVGKLPGSAVELDLLEGPQGDGAPREIVVGVPAFFHSPLPRPRCRGFRSEQWPQHEVHRPRGEQDSRDQLKHGCQSDRRSSS